MGFDGFSGRVSLLLAALFVLVLGSATMFAATDFVVVATLLGGSAVAVAWQLVRSVNRTNAELARFLLAIRYDDPSAVFPWRGRRGSFGDLGSAFEEVMARFRAARRTGEMRRHYLEVLVEHAPVAIIAVHHDGVVTLLNNTARRLLNTSGATSLDALDAYGAGFQRDVAQSRPGERKLTRTELDGVQRHLVITTTHIAFGSEQQRLIALQDIQHELDATELSTWQDMVRVLSHEIGNSITPIASLARTAGDILDELRLLGNVDGAELLSDACSAVQTIARRSEGLTHFVKSYRQLMTLPPPQKHRIPLAPYFDRLSTLLSAETEGKNVALMMGAPAAGLSINADEHLVDQAIINIVRNATDAARSGVNPQVRIDAHLSDRGRPVIEITDNGVGLDSESGEKIFLPFFTTKATGSGIGLSFARQVMMMHGGSISGHSGAEGGAVFRLIF